MTDQEFLAFVKKECKYYGVKYSFPKVAKIRAAGGYAGGYFDDINKLLKVAVRNDYWVDILAHEYCHMTQWAEKCPAWMLAVEHNSYKEWDRHIGGVMIDTEFHFDIIRDLELDNEKRTAALIKKLKLPIDLKSYIKKANSYIMFYNYMKITGRWAKISPYKCEPLVAAMPDKFSLNYTKLSKRMEKLFSECGI